MIEATNEVKDLYFKHF